MPHLPGGPRPSVWLDAGTGDREVTLGMRTMRTELRDGGFDVSLRERPGGHTFAVWRPALCAALDWYTGSIAP